MIEMWGFKYCDPVTGKSREARYRATTADIAERYRQPETGQSIPIQGGFNPFNRIDPADD